MSSHLPILTATFPGQVLLNVDDIARLLHVSKKHIYNLSSAKKLPFRIFNSSDKLLVSVVEMARYLDSKLEPEAPKTNPLENAVVVAKKRGRPRGQGVAKVTLAFQSQLSMSIMRVEIESAFNDFVEDVERVAIDSEDDCCEKQLEVRDLIQGRALEVRSYLNKTMLELKLGVREIKPGRGI